MQRGIGALTPVQEESSTLGTGPRSGYSRKDAGVQGQGPQAKARAGPSNGGSKSGLQLTSSCYADACATFTCLCPWPRIPAPWGFQ